MLIDVSKSNPSVYIFGGSIIEQDINGKLYNTCLVVYNGQVIASYRKNHLYTINWDRILSVFNSDLELINSINSFFSKFIFLDLLFFSLLNIKSIKYSLFLDINFKLFF